MKSIIISLIWNSDFDEVAYITVPVIEAYAERHGYQVMRFHNPPCERNVQWERVRIMQEIFESQKPDVCVHIDLDVLIINPAIKLEDLMPEGDWDIAMSRESGGAWNDGTSMFRDTLATRDFLQTAWDMESPRVSSLNGAIQKSYDYSFPRTMSWPFAGTPMPFKLVEIPKRKFNSYLSDWRPQDFLLHLPGCSNQTRCEVFRHAQALTGSLKEMLRPWQLTEGDELMRLGRDMDGGYLIAASAMQKWYKLFSFGVGEDWSFEESFALEGGSVTMYDHTVEPMGLITNPQFVKQKCTPELIGSRQFGYKSVIKMDIEGDEYECLMALRPEALPCCLIVEFHWIDQNQANLRAVLKHLDSLGFRVVHLHGNNHGKYISSLGLPETIEVTFVNTAHISVGEPYFGTLPLAGLDFPNNPDAPESWIDYTFNGI